MYHSITFGDKNTWDDWHLVPSSRPVFNPPAQKVKTLDIPGGNGLIDLSQALTGYPVFHNRTGSFEFLVTNGYQPWHMLYSDIMDYLHGRTMTAVLEDDPEYYYNGRFTVNAWKSEKNWSKIVIDYNVDPYKWSKLSSVNWAENQFGLQNRSRVYDALHDNAWSQILDSAGNIIQTFQHIGGTAFKNICATTFRKRIEFDASFLGRAPVCPKFIVTSTAGQGVNVHFVNPALGINLTKNIPEGSTIIPDFIFYGETGAMLELWCGSGTANVSIEFRNGRL